MSTSDAVLVVTVRTTCNNSGLGGKLSDTAADGLDLIEKLGYRRPLTPSGVYRGEVIRIAVLLELSVGDSLDGWKVVEAVGEIDLSTAHRVETLCVDLIDEGNHLLVVDLRRVVFMDSTGLAVLLRVLKLVKEHDGDLVVTCVKGPVRRVLAVSGADRRITVRQEAHPDDQV